MNNPQEIRMYTRARSRRRVLDVDLNAAPPCESRDQGGVSNHTRSQEAGRNVTLPQPIDVEALDDDVIISSPTAFAQAKNNARRNRTRTIVVDVDNDEGLFRNKRRRVPANQTVTINFDRLINLESGSNSMRKSGQSAAVPPIHPVPPKEPTFSCPVCMGPLVEEMTTKCGHIFCKACIKASIAAQGKCPTCRRKTTVKDIIRVYLPSTRSA